MADLVPVAETTITPEIQNGLIFTVTGERLGLPGSRITGIIRPPPLTRVPNAPANLLGVVNARGAALPVVSLAGMLGREAGPPTARSRIVVIDGAAPVGVMVDAVDALGRLGDVTLVDLDGLLARDFASLGQARKSIRDPASRGPISRGPISRGPISRGLAPMAPRATERDVLAVVGFMLGGQEYALPLEKIVEVLRPPDSILPVPRTDSAMIGVTANRDGLLPLVSARVLLGLPADGFDRDRGRIVVTQVGRFLVGLVVDSTTAILRIPADSIDAVPPILTRGKGEARIDAIGRLESGRRLVAILSPATIFDADTAAMIAAATVTAATVTAAGRTATQAGAKMETAGTFERFVVFTVGDEQYGVPIGAVEEVVRAPDQIARPPGAPGFLTGMINLRGNPLPIIDQRARLGADEPPRGHAAGAVIVVRVAGLAAGLAVDAVSEVLTIRSDDLKPPPEMGLDDTGVFGRIAMTRGGGRMMLIIDPLTLLTRARDDIRARMTAGPKNMAGPQNGAVS